MALNLHRMQTKCRVASHSTGGRTGAASTATVATHTPADLFSPWRPPRDPGLALPPQAERFWARF